MFFASYRVTFPVPPIDTTGEIWRRDHDSLDGRIQELRSQFENGGFTFTVLAEAAAYWLLSKETFCNFVEATADVTNLFGFSEGEDPMVIFEESPRGDEGEEFKLIPFERWLEIVDILNDLIDLQEDN